MCGKGWGAWPSSSKKASFPEQSYDFNFYRASSVGDEKVVSLKRTNRKCPICGRHAAVETRPFCSKRCADVDLGRWFGENYRMPGEAANIEDEKEE